jgi:hypothetical protein
MAYRPDDAIVTLTIRMPEAMRRNLELEAKKKGASLNAEMVFRLYQSLRDEEMEVKKYLELRNEWVRLREDFNK